MVTIKLPIRVVIAGYEAALRSRLGKAIQAHPQVHLVGEAENGQETLELCQLVHPGVLLLDLDLPQAQGIHITRTIQQRWPEIKIILIAENEQDERLQAGLRVGGWDFIARNAGVEEAIEVMLRTQQAGERLPGHAAPSATASVGDSTHSERIDVHTARAKTRRTIKELEMAGRVQAGILPARSPELIGWEVAARLLPAHETSGDFYDFIPLSNGKWGIVIADVTDKGLGAAVFMALCSTLIRTYADRYHTLPAIAINTVNERIFSDTRGSLYVTVFYGILEPELGRLRYVNAGHNPPLVVSSQRSKSVDRLQRTGIALGVSEEATWQQKIVKFIAGDVLVLYTDGITEAQDRLGRFFGEQHLIDTVRAHAARPAGEILDALLAELNRFTQNAPLQDDTTLVVMRRKS